MPSLAAPNDARRMSAARRAENVSATVASRPSRWLAAMAISPTCSTIVPKTKQKASRTIASNPAGVITNRAMSTLATAARPLLSIKGEITHDAPAAPSTITTLLKTTSNTTSGQRTRQKSVATLAMSHLSVD